MVSRNTTKTIGRISVYLLSVIVIIAIFALLPKIFSSHDFLFQIIAVVLSVVFTAVVTNTLLSGQSDLEEIKDKNSKVFEKKLTIFQDFLNKLSEVIRDGVITKEEAIEIEFATSYIAMHMKSSEDVEEVINNVKKIIYNLDPTKQWNEISESTPEALFNIVSVFKKDLYNEPYDKGDKHIQKAIAAFEDIVGVIDGQLEVEVDDTLSENTEEHLLARGNFQIIINDILSRIGGDWKGEIIKDSPLGFALDKGNRSKLAFYFVCAPKYYFQLQIRIPEREYIDVYDPFKWKFGGRRNKYGWWQYVKQEYRSKDDVMRSLLGNDKAFHNYIVTQVVARIKYFEEFWALYSTVEIPLAGESGVFSCWNLKPAFAYRCIAFDKGDEEKTYFDVRLNENSTYSILLHNRLNNEEALKGLVEKIGDKFSPYTLQGESMVKHLVCSEVSPEDILGEVEKLIEKIG